MEKKTVEELKETVKRLHGCWLAAQKDNCSFSVDFWRDLYLEAGEELENHPDY
jgi:hypothetical protein